MQRTTAVTRRLRDNERGDAALIGCVGLAAFFLLVGFAVIDYWSTLSVDRNLQAIAQDAANAGASGIDVNAYRDNGIVELDPATATSLAIADLRSEPPSELPPSVLGSPCTDSPSLAEGSACFTIDVSGASITVLLHEDVASIVLEVAGHHGLPITVSATSTATVSAYS
jgi:Flp pilus assembly protein TadG